MTDLQSSRSGAWQEAYNGLAQEIDRWIAGAIRRQEKMPFQGGHDECNYTASWLTFAKITGSERPLAFCTTLRDQLIAWPELHHGFYPEANWDIEHSVENWTVFMTTFANAYPDDDVTMAGIEDVAHHLGNWVDGVPKWFDWDKRRFVSEWVGTRKVRNFPPYDFSTYWDARASELALTMFDLRGDKRYLEFAVAFAGGWADYILAQDGLGYWLQFEADTSDRDAFKGVYGEFPERFHAFNIGWIWECTAHMLHVHRLAPDPALVEASRKVIEMAPNYRPGIKRLYQDATGDKRYAADIAAEENAAMSKARQALGQPLPDIVMLEGLAPYPRRLYARRDEAGKLQEMDGPGPGALMRAWQQSGEEAFAVAAMNLAARQLHLAATTLRDGREHGCNGRWVHGAGGEAVSVFATASK